MMLVVCNECQERYFDEIMSTICPHPPLGVAPKDWCREHDLIRQYQRGAFEAMGCPSHEKVQ
jgi:hypothetical protein